MTSFHFEVVYQSTKSRARVGRIHTPHGVIDTPNFVGVGTNGTIKTLDNDFVEALGIQLLFCNTYHLMLQPGPAVVAQAGGLHKYIRRRGPIITDSGGFQVFSLMYGSVANELKSRGMKKSDGSVLKITEEGVLFRSYRDGARVLLTPETSIQAQKSFGADIIVAFDELPPHHCARENLVEALERTHRWERRSLAAHLLDPRGQAMYAVVHGGVEEELRKSSAHTLRALPFDGFAVGGSLGKDRDDLAHVLRATMPELPTERPVHLLGIGDLESVELGVPYGIDTFDSCYPTKIARHGLVLTHKGRLKIERASSATHFGPIEEGCTCPTCQRYTLAYLHHLFKAQEITGLALATVHNLHFMVQLMKSYRERILNGEI